MIIPTVSLTDSHRSCAVYLRLAVELFPHEKLIYCILLTANKEEMSTGSTVMTSA